MSLLESVFALYLSGYSTSEIAVELGISEGRAEFLIVRANLLLEVFDEQD